MSVQAPRPIVTAAYPQLFVTDMTATCAFYTSKLGFKVVFLHGEPPFYGQLERDAARLNLRHVDADDPVFVDRVRQREILLSAYLIVSDVDALFRDFEAAGVEFRQRPATQPWGARDFAVRDPDGNLLLFADS